jgi:hypothetical protein
LQLKVQTRVLELVKEILGGTEERTPLWLMRPGADDCGERWSFVCSIYGELTGMTLPRTMPCRERRAVDCVLKVSSSPGRIIEVDESQHFNCYRATTLRFYPRDVKIAFNRNVWIERSETKKKLEGGGFGKPRPPLFPGDGGRHRQRAFRDALADIIPQQYGFEPTLRIAYFEVNGWLNADDASGRMERLLKDRGLLT